MGLLNWLVAVHTQLSLVYFSLQHELRKEDSRLVDTKIAQIKEWVASTVIQVKKETVQTSVVFVDVSNSYCCVDSSNTGLCFIRMCT